MDGEVKSGAGRINPFLLQALQKLVDEADLIVGFNFKFDYHWLRKWGLRLEHKRLWDCQVSEFVIQRQQNPYPSLNECAETYGLAQKLDVVKTEYWDKGICTSKIPWSVLKPYAVWDAQLTYDVYVAQQEHVSKAQRSLLAVLHADLHVLQEMEKNGITYDEELCVSRGAELDVTIRELRAKLDAFYPDIPILWSSGDQLSAFLYGGTITQVVKEHVGYFKSGQRAGTAKYRNAEIVHQLPRLYTPLRGTELKKEGFYATNEDTLLKLKGKQGPLKVLLELSKLEKLNGTYYKGLPKLNAKMVWPKGYLHGQFNQVVAATGRLSSIAPNLQNFASDLQDVFVTRYAHTG